MFEALFVGVGDAFSVQHWGTSFLCRKEGFVLAVDCPDVYRRALKAAGFEHLGEPLDAQHLDGLFLTHLHGDHVNGLEMVLAYRKFVAGGKLPLWTTPEVAEELWDRRVGVSLGVLYDGTDFNQMMLTDYVDLHIVEWGEPTSVGPFTLETRRTLHHIPTAGVRISDGERTLGYSCDTAWVPEHMAWLSDADLIVHETSLGPAHTPLFELVAQPAEIRNKMLVVHYPDGFEEPDELAFATEGQRHVVGEPTR